VNINSNYELKLALDHAGYDSKLVVEGGHNSKHGSAILPDALRWLWRDIRSPSSSPRRARHFLTNSVLDPDRDWELVSEGHKFTGGLAVDVTKCIFSDIANNRIHRIGLDSRVTVFKEGSGGPMG